MKSALQRAIDVLKIEDVSVRSMSASLADGFEPKLGRQASDLEIALKRQITGFEIIEIGLEEGQTQTLFRVLVDLGVRWSEPSPEVDSVDGVAGAPSDQVEVATVEATMVAEYGMATHPGEDALTEFALQNASFHIWPYWREYVSSQCHRMNLPPLMLPTRQFAQKPPEEND